MSRRPGSIIGALVDNPAVPAMASAVSTSSSVVSAWKSRIKVPAFGGSEPFAMALADMVDELLLDDASHQGTARQVLHPGVVSLPGGLGQADVIGRHLVRVLGPVPLANSDPPPTARRSWCNWR